MSWLRRPAHRQELAQQESVDDDTDYVIPARGRRVSTAWDDQPAGHGTHKPRKPWRDRKSLRINQSED